LITDFTDQEAVQRFFLQEVQLGEELLAQGDIEAGVEHLGLAVAVCGQPHSLLGVLQQTLPPQAIIHFSYFVLLFCFEWHEQGQLVLSIDSSYWPLLNWFIP
jgi:hypothetical protein